MKLTYLSLGSNIGDKKNHIQSALNKIDRTIGNIISISSLYENPSEGFEGEMFFNCCISLETTFSAKELLKKLLSENGLIAEEYGEWENNEEEMIFWKCRKG